MVVDLLVGSCICTWNKRINSRAISPLTFFFKNSFLILKYISKTATGVVIKNKLLLKLFGILPGTHQYWSLFLIKLQDLRTFTRLIFYIDYKDFIFLQVKPCKAMLIEVYLEPSRTSTMELFLLWLSHILKM